MSLEYVLEIEDKLDISDLFSHIMGITDMSFSGEKCVTDKLTDTRICIYNADIGDEDDVWGIRFIKNNFGFYPKVSIRIYPDKFKYEASNELMMKLVYSIISGLKGDAAFIFDESPCNVLQKIDSIITIDIDWANEPGMMLVSETGIPYKIEKLPDFVWE